MHEGNQIVAKVTKTFQYGNHQVTLETGEVARQASGAVIVKMSDTVVLVSVVGSKSAREGVDFFPLTVDYQEKFYAGGRIPGGFFKREARPSERETLTSRLIDRPIRPLFPEGFRNEVQVIATVVSLNPEVEGDIPALIGTSAALAISGIPFNGPIGAAKVGYANGQYLLNPTATELKTSELELVVAGTSKAVLMVESEAKLLSEDVMLGAVTFGHEQMQAVIQAIKEFAAEAGKPRWDWQAPARNEAVIAALKGAVGDRLMQAFTIQDKLERRDAIAALKKETLESLAAQAEAQGWAKDVLANEFGELEYHTMRQSVLSTKRRIDGRDLSTVRPITVKVGVLPRTHGSALFTRGETQALVVTTLGTARDGQVIDAVEGESKDNFLFHYNFPPYSVGEVGRMAGPKRREIGHGRLAKRGVLAVMPSLEAFPYTVRVVSEITESNGSSSMASVCGSSLALMDAGVPMKSPVAGIAMGLVKEGEDYVVLTDILGDEDHLGDMDFKVAGTADGVSALQMDIKIDGITEEIMRTALAQAKRGVQAVKPTLAEFPYVIRVVSEITESNGSSSMASVCGSSLALMDAGVPVKAPVAGIAMGLIKEGDRFAVLSDILGDEDHLGDMDFKVAGTAEGISALQMDIKIDGITEEIMRTALAQAREGRLHILGEMAKVITKPRAEMSEYAPRLLTFKIHPDKIREVIGKGGSVIRSITEETGTTIDIQDDGTVIIASVNRAAAEAARKRVEQITADVEPGQIYEGKVAKLMDFGAFVTILPGRDGLVHVSQISSERVEKVSDKLKEGDAVRVKVLEVDKQGRIRLSIKAVTEDEATPA